MGSQYINNENFLNGYFEVLKYSGVFTNYQVIKKLSKLVDGDIDNFSKTFSTYISQKDFSYNKFELLKLSSTDKKKIDNNLLYRFEYRKNSNLRIIFVFMIEGNNVLVVDAFNENGNKTKGKDSYDKAIKNAIRNYEMIKEEIYE